MADLSGDIWVHVRGDCAVGGNPCMDLPKFRRMCLAVGHFRHRHNKFHSSAYVHSAGPSLMGDARQLCGSIRNLSKYRQTWLGSCRSCDPSRSATVIGISFYTILLYFFHIRIMLMLPSWMACVENGFRAAVFLNWDVRELLVSMLSDDTSMTD